MQHNAAPSAAPQWTPNPMMRRVNWSMRTRTRWVLEMADSDRNRSKLHRLSFAWPRNVSQEVCVVKIQLGGDHNVNSTLPERAVRICRSQKLVLSVNHQL